MGRRGAAVDGSEANIKTTAHSRGAIDFTCYSVQIEAGRKAGGAPGVRSCAVGGGDGIGVEDIHGASGQVGGSDSRGNRYSGVVNLYR